MLCKIADLIVSVPEAGDLIPRCEGYITDEMTQPDIVIREERFNLERWKHFDDDFAVYIESGLHLHYNLLEHQALVLHSSAVELDGKAYLFSAPSGTGKSTHTGLWQTIFGDRAKVFNDDKPILRRIDGVWYAYGSPWSGHGPNINMKAPLAGICFLKQAPENKIRRLSQPEAIQKIIWQTTKKFKNVERLDLMLSHVESIVQQIPVFELENRPEPEAARLSYDTMQRAAEEMHL